METKPSWLQGLSNVLGISVDPDALRTRLQAMSDADLLAFGKQMHELVYQLTYDGDGKPVGTFQSQTTLFETAPHHLPNGDNNILWPLHAGEIVGLIAKSPA